jgi:UPF0755 protein
LIHFIRGDSLSSDDSRPESKVWIKKTAVVLVAVVCLAIFLSHRFWNRSLDAPLSLPEEGLFYIVKKQTSFQSVLSDLKRRGILDSTWEWRLYGMATGDARRLKAGEYLLEPGLTPRTLMRKFVRGEVFLARITVPEGAVVTDIGRILERGGVAHDEEFVRFALAPDTARELDVPGPTLEGYLFPETYLFPRNSNPEAVARRMVEEWRKVFAPYLQRVKEGDLSVNQVMTLASIVEKETALEEERGLVASVFLNRLRRNMMLQADPTVIYGVPGFDGNLTRNHLRKDTPYNTYTRTGLPPGPIASPGASSIHAVLYPPETDYLYFVSTNQGAHLFSKTLSQHNRYVRKHQKRAH